MENKENMLGLKTTLDRNFVPNPKVMKTKGFNTLGTSSNLRGGKSKVGK